MATDTYWFKQVQELQLPAFMPASSLPAMSSSDDEWISVIREDPLLTIHLFRYANTLLTSHTASVRTIDQALGLLGKERIIALERKITRIDLASASAKGLLMAIGDSLLAASLMRQWFEIRQIPWTETDYWLTLFHDLGIWVCWLLEPEQMDSIELRASQGESRDELISHLLGMPLRDWNNALCRHYQLPTSVNPEDSAKNTDTHIQPFKRSALTFFLPFSHELAFATRQDWTSQKLTELCRKGEIALGLTEFKLQLKSWVAVAAREFKLPHASLAARRLLAQQPVPMSTSVSTGFSDSDLALANKLSQLKFVTSPALTEPDEQPKKLARKKTPESHRKTGSKSTPTAAVKKLSNNTTSSPPNHSAMREGVRINDLREIRQQFRNVRTWHSPVEIQESALFGLVKGLNLSRIVVMELTNGFWQSFDNEGCRSHPLMRSLKFPKSSSSVITELSHKVTVLWVNKRNQKRAEQQLPPPLVAAAESESFFLRSFEIANKVTMLLYADAYGQEDALNEADYKLFREFCADWNTALNNVRL